MVKVGRTVGRAIRERPTSLALQVGHATGRPEAEVALEAARAEIAALDGGWESAPGLRPGDRNGPTFVSRAISAPAGPILFVDGGHTPQEVLQTIPEVIARHLMAVGLGDATITVAESGGPLDDFAYVPRSVILRLFPPPPPPEEGLGSRAAIPAEWLEVSEKWLTTDRDADYWIRCGVQFQVHAADVARVVAGARRVGECLVVAGARQTVVRGISAMFVGFQGLALAFGGPGATDAQLIEAIESVAELARTLAPTLGYGFVALEPSFAMFADLEHGTPWTVRGPSAALGWVKQMCDEVVLDGFPIQILGPQHVARLRRTGVDLSAPGLAFRELDNGRAELAVGAPADWLIEGELPSSENPWDMDQIPMRRGGEIQTRAREVLASCLLREENARAYILARSRGETQER